MDNISTESNTSYLPITAGIIGVVALILGVVALVKLSNANTELAALNEKLARVETFESDLRSITTAAERAATTAERALSTAETSSRALTTLRTSSQEAFSEVAKSLEGMRGELVKVQEVASRAPAARPVATGGSAAAAPVVGAGEYVVKSGDTGMRIARENNVTLAELMAANPSVNWNRLGVGQVIAVPRR